VRADRAWRRHRAPHTSLAEAADDLHPKQRRVVTA
jgi:hypothetical protein